MVHSGLKASIPTEQDETMSATPTVVVEWIGGNCPVQSEGTINGQPYYFRARGESWSIEIGGGFVLEDDEKGIPAEGFYLEREYGDEAFAAGWMSVEDARGFIQEAAVEYAKATLGAPPSTCGTERSGVNQA